MKYQNPIIPGYYPDPSICTDGKKFYLVNSSFHNFPGVPLFESDDLINWKQIGHVLTRESQLPLTHATHSGGIYAPVIRYHNGRFYMITTNVSDGGNFIVYTDDIYGEWSEPIWIKNGGIDPSLLFDGDKVYFCGTGADENGRSAILGCEIDIETGENLTEPKAIWYGTGGRYLEGPHLYHIGDDYYVFAAEGGTEYGHMIVYGKGKSPMGPFENYKGNPVLTNRNLGGYQIQGVGHGDLVMDKFGDWWMVHLAFRTLGQYDNYHLTGRETYLVPVNFDADGWFTAGDNGTTRFEFETDRKLHRDVTQTVIGNRVRTFENTKPGREWIYQRNPEMKNYEFKEDKFFLTGTDISINDPLGSSTVISIRQEEMYGFATVKLTSVGGPAGLTLIMDDSAHYDLTFDKGRVSLNARLGEIKSKQSEIETDADEVTLTVRFSPYYYYFEVEKEGNSVKLGRLETRFISTEVASGFTGVLIGLFAEKGAHACFSDFKVSYQRTE